jgi:TM2 domain-containing membrane protein YozV
MQFPLLPDWREMNFMDVLYRIDAGRGNLLQAAFRRDDSHRLVHRYNDGMNTTNETHSVVVGYILWLFGFTGSHRFYFGKPITGTIWFFTGGLLLVGWIIDLFLIPGMARRADLRYQAGPIDYTLAWIFLTFLGIFGIHRFYIGKWITGIIYLLTGGLVGIGLLYDLWTLNGQVSEMNRYELTPGR